MKIEVNATTPGRRAIAGFLLQILRSIRLGLEMSLTLTPLDDGNQMTLHLEPEEGSDAQVTGGARDLVEQIKMRNEAGKWTSGEVASKVIPDLLRAVDTDRDQQFRFVTNNPNGLGRLQGYLASRGNPTHRHRWGSSSLTREQFELRIARSAGLDSVTEGLRRLLDNLEIEIIDPEATEAEIEAAVAPLLKPGDDATDKRFQLTGQLMTLSTGGARLTPDDLMALISPQARRLLAHIQSLPAFLAQHVDEDAQLIGYVKAEQARRSLPMVSSGFAVLSGESGQGKTWTLAQLAFTQIARGELAIVTRSPTRLADVEKLINERVWQPAHPVSAALSVIGKHLGAAFRDADGYWLTVYIDDVQDRKFAGNLARAKWEQLGIRTVVSAQPRITQAMSSIRKAEVIDIGNFTSADLLRYLKHHDRAEALETMPDDVFELLLKPVHASIFVQLPKRYSWSGASEYELFSSYWEQAALLSREQPDHPGDKSALSTLAGRLTSGQSNYPWRVPDLHAVGLEDDAILRLEQVGLLRRPVPDRVQFAADRMLNWAIAESLAERIQEEGLIPAEAEALLGSVEELKTKKKERIGTRLGYVFFDALWLLAAACEPEFVADLIWEHAARLPQEHRAEGQWRDGFGSIGVRILPALEILAQRAFDEETDWDIPRNIPFAMAAIAGSEPKAVEALIARQVSSPVDREVTMGLRAARLVPATAALDAIWMEHLRRAHDYRALTAESEVGQRSRASSSYSLSWDALHRAASAKPEWLDARLAIETDPVAIDQLLWLLKDEKAIEHYAALEMWSKHRERIAGLSPTPGSALIHAIGHFRDASLAIMLDAADISDEWQYDRVLRSRARLAPQEAIEQIAEGSDLYGWRSSNWWFDELHAADPQGLAAAIRKRAESTDNPLTDIVLYYGHNPEAVDAPTLEFMLDRFASDLRAFNDQVPDPDGREGRLGHPLRFLPRLSEPWQFEAVRARAGTDLEAELVRFATARRGRISMTSDTTGNEVERILAMIGGDGYDRLVLSELARPHVFGRQDGYISARWSTSDEIAAALAASPIEDDAQTFGQVARMEALAVHRADAALEAMVRAGAPIYLDPANTRCTEGRNVEALRARIAELLAAEDAESLDAAAALTGFLGSDDDALRLVALFVRPGTTRVIRRRIIASLRALDFYAPEMLPQARELMEGQIDEEAQFVATYLAERGDGEARKAVIAWLEPQDMGTSSTAQRAYLGPLLRHPDGTAAVLAFLRRSRANGHIIIDGGLLQLLAEDGDEAAQAELSRAAYRHSGFGRENSVTAIRLLAREQPDEAYFAAKRMLSRHGLPVAADLMLMIDRERGSRELIERYRSAKPSLRLELRRLLRVRLGGPALAALIEPLAVSPVAGMRAVAAEIGGAIPPLVAVPWLDALAEDGSPLVHETAREALRARSNEASALEHRDLLLSSLKPVQWARLTKIIELVDPYFLWSSSDPSSLEDALEQLPYEFTVEARQARRRNLKEREDLAKKADRDA
jgi:hypothetical protein